MNCIGGLKQLRLRHEVHLAPDEGRDEEVIEEREVVRHDDRRPLGRDLVGVDHAPAVEEQQVRREHDPHELVDPVRLARARALVEAREVLGGAGILVDLRLHVRVATRAIANGYLFAGSPPGNVHAHE
jgi:hypothetical protein